jgi:hypothetical protein
MLLLTVLAFAMTGPQAQGLATVDLDHVLSTVHSTKIWKSDVRQARMLKLCDPSAQSDDAILTELQNRVLMLAEVARGQASEPTADQLAARRRDWEQALGAGPGLDALMARAGMTPRDLQGWLRDDLRITNYLDQRFGALPPPQRTTRVKDWVADLRQRAGLK